MNCLFCNKQCIGKNNVCQDCSTNGQEYYCNVSKSHDPIKHMKISKLKIKLKIAKEAEYNKERAKFISDYEVWNSGNIFSPGHYERRPDIGEAKWNSFFPEGFRDWQAQNGSKLTTVGEQAVIDKINEIVDKLNKVLLH